MGAVQDQSMEELRDDVSSQNRGVSSNSTELSYSLSQNRGLGSSDQEKLLEETPLIDFLHFYL